MFCVYNLAEAGDGTMEQRSENVLKHSQRSKCKMQFRIAKKSLVLKEKPQYM